MTSSVEHKWDHADRALISVLLALLLAAIIGLLIAARDREQRTWCADKGLELFTIGNENFCLDDLRNVKRPE